MGSGTCISFWVGLGGGFGGAVRFWWERCGFVGTVLVSLSPLSFPYTPTIFLLPSNSIYTRSLSVLPPRDFIIAPAISLLPFHLLITPSLSLLLLSPYYPSAFVTTSPLSLVMPLSLPFPPSNLH